MNLTKRELELYKKIISFRNVNFSIDDLREYENEFYKLLMYSMIELVYDYDIHIFKYTITKEHKF